MIPRLIAAVGIVLCVSACSDSDDDDDVDTGVDLGAQIDGMGRAAVNTALVTTFAADATRAAAEDNYNATDNSNRGVFAATMADQLAVYDALVGSCGDNPLTNRVSANPAEGLASGADRYNFIAAVFADDQIYVNSSSGGAEAGQCNQYLAAELGVVGVTGAEADCGGRTLLHDTIGVTYSAVAVGSVTGVDDGIPSDNIAHSLTAFPFLAPPQT